MKLLPILCLSFVGCVGDAPATDSDHEMEIEQVRIDRDQHLVLRVQTAPDRSLGIYQPQPGTLVMSQVGRNGRDPVELPNDPVAAFQMLAPDREVPHVLLDAIAGKQIELADAVTIDVTPTQTAYSFPQQSFQCWVKNQYACMFHQKAIDHRPHGWDILYQSFNAVWAVENGWVHTTIALNLVGPVNPNTKSGPTYDYDTYDGWWRTFQVTGTFQVYFGAYSATTWNPDGSRGYDSYFHYSSAGAQ